MEKRCIIPVSDFFETHEYKGKKYPYFFKNEDESLFAPAGLYTVVGPSQFMFLESVGLFIMWEAAFADAETT